MTISCTGLSPSLALFPAGSTFVISVISQSYNPVHAETSTVWANARSLATTCAITFVFSSCGYLDVSVPHVSSSFDVTGLQPDGLPHSDTPVSMVICTYTGLFAAYHVLLRRREPRHPPSALLLLFYLPFTQYKFTSASPRRDDFQRKSILHGLFYLQLTPVLQLSLTIKHFFVYAIELSLTL